MADVLRAVLETILVVENDEALLRIIVTHLEDADFRVLSACTGPDAVKLAAKTQGAIHLLLSAVDLLEMSGPDLGKLLKSNRPDMLVMLMSGQGNGNLLILNYGWAYIRQPFIAAKLVEMVTAVLNSPDRSQLGDEFDSSKDTSLKKG